MSNKFSKTVLLGFFSFAISGCATMQEPTNETIALQNQYMMAEQQSYVEKYAPLEFEDAKKMIEKTKKMEKSGKSEELIEHQRYLAQKKLDTAIELAKEKRAQERVDNAALNRKDVLLAAKSKELNEAQDEAQRMSKRAKLAEREAEEARERAKEMSAKAKKMAATLTDISATDTERGLVITMGSILFELNESELKSSSKTTVAKIADFLNQYPERDVLVEGFTDSTGSSDYNQTLSDKRAKAVTALLAGNGIDKNRLNAVGYGESYPAATNDTQLGRQKNRRVEIVVAHTDNRAVQVRSQ